TLIRQLAEAGLSDAFGNTRIDLHVLNVTYPIVPDEIVAFARDKRAVLILEEGSPEFIEHFVLQAVAPSDCPTKVVGKKLVAATGELTGELVAQGLRRFLGEYTDAPDAVAALDRVCARISKAKTEGAAAGAVPLPPRGPTFCSGCPERPVFGAM